MVRATSRLPREPVCKLTARRVPQAFGDLLRTALAPDNLAASAEHGAPIAAAAESLLQCIAAEPNRVPQATAQGRSVYQGYPTDESDICEGGSLVPPPTSHGARAVRGKFSLPPS